MNTSTRAARSRERGGEKKRGEEGGRRGDGKWERRGRGKRGGVHVC